MNLTRFTLAVLGVLAAVLTVYSTPFPPHIKFGLLIGLVGLLVYLAIQHRPPINAADLVYPRSGWSDDSDNTRDR